MKNARIIAVLALLALSLSGCANTDRFVVPAPPSQETVTTEPAQNTVPREQGTVPVSESTEIPAESTEPTEIVEAKSEVSIPAKEETPPTVNIPTETTPPKASEPEPPEEPTETQPQEPKPPDEEEPTEPAFDIQTWIDDAKAYAESVGLRLESSAVDCWDNPIDAAADRIYLERDICSRLNRYKYDESGAERSVPLFCWQKCKASRKRCSTQKVFLKFQQKLLTVLAFLAILIARRRYHDR